MVEDTGVEVGRGALVLELEGTVGVGVDVDVDVDVAAFDAAGVDAFCEVSGGGGMGGGRGWK